MGTIAGCCTYIGVFHWPPNGSLLGLSSSSYASNSTAEFGIKCDRLLMNHYGNWNQSGFNLLPTHNNAQRSITFTELSLQLLSSFSLFTFFYAPSAPAVLCCRTDLGRLLGLNRSTDVICGVFLIKGQCTLTEAAPWASTGSGTRQLPKVTFGAPSSSFSVSNIKQGWQMVNWREFLLACVLVNLFSCLKNSTHTAKNSSGENGIQWKGSVSFPTFPEVLYGYTYLYHNFLYKCE